MDQNRIEIIAPTGRAYERMKEILFRPFDMGKWFILGFSAWLATLLDGGGSGPGGSGPGTSDSDDDWPEDFSEMIESAQQWLSDNLGLVVGIGAFLVFVIVSFVLALTWVQSRGKFMFLDNVVHNRALVSDPWTRYSRHGNSLFRWMIVYGLVVFLFVVAILYGVAATLFPMAMAEEFDPAAIPTLVALGVAFTLLILVISYIGFLLENAVIPIMYRHELVTTEAWRRVFSIHSQAFGSFLLLFLWLFLISLVVGVMVVALVLVTCCLAGLILMIPYLGTVLLLPVFVFYRAIGIEFLRQFGEEYDLYPEAPEPPTLPMGDPASGS